MVKLIKKKTFFINIPQPLTTNLIASSVTNGTGSATFDNPIPEDEFEPVPDPTPDPGDPTINVTTICIDCVDPSPENPPIGPILVDESGSYYPPIDLPETASVVINGKYKWFFEGEFEPTVDFDESKIYVDNFSIVADSDLPGSPNEGDLGFVPGWPLDRGIYRRENLPDPFVTSYDGNIFAIGKNYYDFYKGGVWVWEYNLASDQWIERKLPDPPGLEDMECFGSSIAINQAGDIIAVASSRIFAGFSGLYYISSGGNITNTLNYKQHNPAFGVYMLRDKVYWDTSPTGFVRPVASPPDWDRNDVKWAATGSDDPTWLEKVEEIFSGYPTGSLQELRNLYKDKKQRISIYKKTYNSGFDNPVWTHSQDIELSGTLEQIAKLQAHSINFVGQADNGTQMNTEPLYFSLDGTLYVKMRKNSFSLSAYEIKSATENTEIGLKFSYSFLSEEYEPALEISHQEIQQVIENEKYDLGLKDLSGVDRCYISYSQAGVTLTDYRSLRNTYEFTELGKTIIKNSDEYLVRLSLDDAYAQPYLEPTISWYRPSIIVSGLSNLIATRKNAAESKYPLFFGTVTQEYYFPYEILPAFERYKNLKTCEEVPTPIEYPTDGFTVQPTIVATDPPEPQGPLSPSLGANYLGSKGWPIAKPVTRHKFAIYKKKLVI